MECLTKHIDFSIGSLSFGKWVAQEDIIVADIVLNEIEDVQATSIAKKREHLHNLIKSELTQKQFKCIKMILDFFGKQFAKNNIPTHRHYLYSVYLANRLFDLEQDGQKIEGIQYPSIAMNYQGDNVVLKPETINNGKLKLVETYEVMSAISKKTLYSKITNQSNRIEHGEIFWRKEGTIHGEGYFDEIASTKTPFEKGGQGFLKIELKFEREKVLTILNEMKIEQNIDFNSPLQYLLTKDCEIFAKKYCHITYTNGTFKRCEINEREKKVTFMTSWGFLMRPRNEILFALGGGVYAFKEIPSLSFEFLPATQNSDVYKKYNENANPTSIS